MEEITPEHIARTQELMEQGYFSCTLRENVANLYIDARVRAGEHSAHVTIINRHTLITEIGLDGRVLYQTSPTEGDEIAVDRSRLNVKDILEFADTVELEKVRAILDRQIELNSAIADVGLSHGYGTQVGRTLLDIYGDNVQARAKARAAAGSDARMGGCSLPVVINSGSGNQGMTVSLPVIEYAKERKVSREPL